MSTDRNGGSDGPIGVLVMAYGGPTRIEDVAAYLQDVRGGRDTPDHVVREVEDRYRQIGGRSPILDRTRSQATALQRALDGGRFRTVVGMRHWHPYVRAALEQMEAEGIHRAVGLVMAPHYSRMSVGAYFDKVAAAQSGVAVAPIRCWHLLSGYLDAVIERVRAGLDRFPEADRARVPVLFTAHSLPERIRTWNDPYARQMKVTVAALKQRLGSQPVRFAYQSAGMSPEPWLGPDAGAVINELAAGASRYLLVAPIGFTCEHVEVLYDIDVVYARQAQALGVWLERIEMLNDAPTMIAGLASMIECRARQAGWL